MAKSKKPATLGRPPGAANRKSGVIRDEIAVQFRCSEGFNKVVAMLMKEGHYKSKADVYHEALQLLALKKEVKSEPNYNFWVSKIQ